MVRQSHAPIPRRPARRGALAFVGVLALLGVPPGARAEQPPPPPSQAPPPAATNPLSTTTAPNPPADPNRSNAPAADKALVPPGSGQAPPPLSAAPPRAEKTLVETPAEAGDVDEVTLPAKPAAMLAGRAKWDDGVAGLRAAFARIRGELGKAGLAPTGRPLTVFTGTDDDGFQFEAMIPVEAVPAGRPALGDGVAFGATPAGRAMRFAHKGSYDAIDGTYETLTAYLDAKDVVVQDRFIEEYVTDLKDAADDGLDVNIYALLK